MEQQNLLGCHVEMIAPGKSLDSPDEKKYISAVEDLTGDRLLLAMPMYQSKYAPLHKEERYDVYILVKRKILQCRVVVQGAVKEDKNIFLVTKIISPFRKYERREFFRLSFQTPVFFRKLEPELVEIYRQYLKEEKEMLQEGFSRGNGIDLSAGGLKFTSEERLQVGDTVVIRFTVNQDTAKPKTYVILSKVIESVRHPTQIRTYINRVSFELHNAKVRESLISFVFQEQRRALKSAE